MDDLIAERRRELTQLGEPPRYDIRMFPLFTEEWPSGVLIPAVNAELRDVVEEIGRQFKREGGYDFAPFDASDENSQGVLINSQKFKTTFSIAAGAAAFTRVDGLWWSELEEIYGRFHIDGPYSASMSAFIRSEGIDTDRLNHPLWDEPV